jgi:molybdopterin-binding protein
MVWVSHDAIELQAVCDELVAFDSGHVVARGTPRDVLTNPSIFPAVENTGFSNLLRCQIVSSTEDETVVQLAGTDPNVNLCVAGGAAGQQADDAWLTIPARSILIATEDPTHVSARNTLRGTVVNRKKQTRGIVMLEISLDDRGSAPPMIVEVTQAACDKLSLTPNRTVYVLVKSTACVLNATR